MVKKNGQRVVPTMRNGRPSITKIDTPQYKQWHKDALKQTMWGSRPIDYPIILQCHFYMRTHGQVDLSNLYEGIQDVLVEQGVLADDNFNIIAGHDGSRVFYDKENPRIEAWVIPFGEVA